MNKIYKLVYSRTLNNLVVVGEIASSHAVGSVDKRKSELKVESHDTGRKIGNILLGAALLAGAPAVASANTANNARATETTSTPVATQTLFDGKIEVDAESAKQGLSVTDVKGTAVINIVDSNAAGVSDNRFKAFSTEKGAVFNNSKIELQSSVLGEKLAANPNLKKEAEVILAQVTGNDKSVIKGTLEVLGKKADLMIINPNGIDLNGVALVNSKSFTASTAEVSAENYKQMTVKQGQINVNGDLTTDDVDMIRLIAHAVKVKATIAPSKANVNGKKADIVVSGGAQKFDLGTNTASKLDGVKAGEPRVAISGDNLGSMYGNKVNFIVTESGAGVEFDGMVMGDDDIKVTADGKVKVNKVVSAKNVEIESKGAVEVGTAKATTQFNEEKRAEHAAGTVTAGVTATTTTPDSTTIETTVDTTVEKDTSSDAKLDAATTKSKFVSGENISIKGQTVKLADSLVSAKDKVKVETTSTSQTGLDLTVKNSVLSGHEVTTKGLNTHIDKDSKVLADNVELTGQRTYVDGLVYADNAKISGSMEQGGIVKFSGKAVANTLEVSSKVVNIAGSDITTGTTTLDGQVYKVSDSKIKTNNLAVKAHSLTDKTFEKTESTSWTANNVELDVVKGVDISTAENFATADKILSTIIANNKNITVDNILIDKTTVVKSTVATSFTVRDTFTNHGVLNLSQKAYGSNVVTSTDKDGKKVVITTGKKFENYGLLLADRLGVKAASEINLGGATFVFNDFTVVAPHVNQTGDLNVVGNLNAVTDKYDLSSQMSGSVKVSGANENFASNYSDWRLRRDYYEVYSQIGQLDGADIKLEGGTITVKGDFTIVPLAGSEFAKGTDSESKTFNDVKGETRLNVLNGDIYVGGNLAVDGNISSKVKAFESSVLDLLKLNSNHIEIRYKPTTWINTDLMALKTQKFDSLYTMFEGVFGFDSSFEWNNGAYWMQPQYIMDAFRSSLNDAYTNKILSVVFGSDWRNQSVDEMKASWVKFKDNPNSYKVALWSPGAQIVTGGSIDQINGSIDMGADVGGTTTVLKDAQGRNYAIQVEQATSIDTKKLQRSYSLSSTLDSLQALGVTSVKDGKVVSNFNIPYLNNVANISLFAPAGSQTLAVDNQVAAQLILEQVKSQTGTYYFTQNTDANVVNGLLTNTVKFNEKLAKLQEDHAKAVAAANGNKSVIEKLDAQLKTQVERLKASTDRVEFVKAQGAEGYVPVVVFAESTLDRAATLSNSAAVLNANDAIRIHNAESVKSNFGTIAAEKVAIKADHIDLTTNGVQNAIIAKYSGFQTKDFTLKGSAALGTTSIEADNVKLESAATLNEAGDLVQVGNLYTEAARLNVAEDLVMKGFTFISSGDVEFNVGGKLDLLSKYEVASRYSKQLITNTLGSQELHEAAYTVHGSSIIADGKASIKADTVSLESSRLAADKELNVTVDTDLESNSKANVYDATLRTEKVDLTIGGKVDFGSFHVEGTTHLGTTLGHPVSESVIDRNSAVTKAGQPVASVGLKFGYTTAEDTVTQVKTANNALDSQNLNLNVGSNADLSNTDINKSAQAIAEKRAEDNKTEVETPNAVINAGSVSTDKQGIDITSTTHDEKSVSFGIEGYHGGVVYDAVSHITSAARANSLGEKVDGTFALTVVGDVTGVLTRDLVNGGVRAGLSVEGNKSESETVGDNRNTYAGNIAINTDGDLSLKAVDGEKVNDLKLNAGGDLSIEGGKTSTKVSADSFNFGVSADLSAGASLQGAAVAASGTISGGGQFMQSESVKVENSGFDAAKVELKGQNIDLTSTSIKGSEVKVDAAQDLTVKSEQSTVNSTTHGFGIHATGGASLNTDKIVTPFGSVGGSYNYHKVDNAVVDQVAGVQATEKLEVKSDSVELVGSQLVAQGDDGSAKSATVDVNTIKAQDLQDHRYEDGGNVGLTVGVNKYGNVTVDIQGGRDKQDKYKATNQATIAGEGVDVAGKVIQGSVNTDTPTTVVHEDYKVQDTAFGITINETVVNRVKQGAQAVVEAVATVKEAVSDAVSSVVDAIQNGPDVTFFGPDTSVDGSTGSLQLDSQSSSTQSVDTDVQYRTHDLGTWEGLQLDGQRPQSSVSVSTDSDAPIMKQQMQQVVSEQVVETIKQKQQHQLTQDSEGTVPWVIPSAEDLASFGATGNSEYVPARGEGGVTGGSLSSSSSSSASSSSSSSSASGYGYGYSSSVSTESGSYNASSSVSGSSSSTSVTTDTRYVVTSEGTAYPVYHPHGSLAGTVPGSATHVVVEGGEIAGYVSSTNTGVFNYATGITAITSTTTSHISSDYSSSASVSGSYSSTSGSVTGGYYGTTSSGLTSTSTGSVSSSADKVLVFAGTYDPCSCTTTYTPVGEVSLPNRVTSSTTTSSSTGETVYGLRGDYNNWPSLSTLVGSTNTSTTGVSTSTTTHTTTTDTSTSGDTVYGLRGDYNNWPSLSTLLGGTSSSTTGTTHTTTTDSSTDTVYGLRGDYNNWPSLSTLLGGSSTSTTSTTTTTTSSDSVSYSSALSGSNPPPSYFHLTPTSDNTVLHDQYIKFNETGNVNTALSGKYSEIFAGVGAGTGEPGKAGTVDSVLTAEELLAMREVPKFSGFDNQITDLTEQVNKTKAEIEALKQQLVTVPPTANGETDASRVQIEEQIKQLETVVSETTTKIEVIKETMNKTYSDDRNSIEYVREELEVSPSVGVSTDRVVSDPHKVVDSTRGENVLEFEDVYNKVGVEQSNESTSITITTDRVQGTYETPTADSNTGNGTSGGTTGDSSTGNNGSTVVPPEPQPEIPTVDLTTDKDIQDQIASEKAQDFIPGSNPSITIEENFKPEPVIPDNGGDNQGGDNNQGGGDNNQGGGDNNQGGGDNNQGGGDNNQGGGDNNQGGGDNNQGGGDNNQGGGDNNQGGGDNNQGGGDNNQGGGGNNQGGGDNNQGGNSNTTPDVETPDTDVTIPGDNGTITPNPVIPSTPVVTPSGDDTVDLDNIRDEIRREFDDSFRHYTNVELPNIVDPNVNFDDTVFAFMDGLDGSNNINQASKPSKATVAFASAKPRTPVTTAEEPVAPTKTKVTLSSTKPKASTTTATAPAKTTASKPSTTKTTVTKTVTTTAAKPTVKSAAPAPRKVTLASAKAPSVVSVMPSHRGTGVKLASAKAPTPVSATTVAPKATKVALSSIKPVVAKPAQATTVQATQPAVKAATPVNNKAVLAQLDDTIDSLACANPLVANLNSHIDGFREDVLVINRGTSVQPNFDNVMASIKTYQGVFGAGKQYSTVDNLRTDLGYRTVAEQREAERQDTIKRKQIDLSLSQLQQVSVDMEKLAQRAKALRATVAKDPNANANAVAAEYEQIKQQELSLLKQYRDLRNAIYSLTDGYNFGFSVSNDKVKLNRLLENLTLVSNGQNMRNDSDVHVTIKDLDTYLYGTQAVKYSSFQKVKSSVTYDNFAGKAGNYASDKKLQNETSESISVNAKNLRMRVANLHIELKRLADNYSALQDKVAKMSDANAKKAQEAELARIANNVRNIIAQVNQINLKSNVNLVKTMDNVTRIENSMLSVRNQVSALMGSKSVAKAGTAVKKSKTQSSVLEEQAKAAAIVAEFTDSHAVNGTVKVYRPEDTDVLTSAEVKAVDSTVDLRAKARQARKEVTSVDTNTGKEN